MALIVEVIEPRTGEVRQRLRLDGAPLTIGRGLDNQIILDDRYVDAHHARLVSAEDDTVVLEDLGSVNQLETTHEGRQRRIVITDGVQVVVGHTVLRFRDEHAPIAPARPLQQGLFAGAGRGRDGEPWFERTPGRLAVVAAVLALAGIDAWLASSKRGAASEALTMMLGAAFALAVWAGIWSVAARAVIGQFRFLAHLAVASVAMGVAIVLSIAKTWAEFLLPDSPAIRPIYASALLVGLAALLAAQLAHASHVPRWRRWRAGAIASGVVLALIGIFALLEDDEFTSAAKFSGILKPVTTAVIPTQSVAEFDAVLVDLRAEVDSLLAVPKR